MKPLNFERALVLGAHTDDEFGCSGTMTRLLESGADVYYAVFSSCEESVPEGYPGDILIQEVQRSTQVIGLPSDHLILYDFRVRHFPALRQEILEELVKLRKELQPDLLLLPAPTDIHQDHQVISREGIRAFKYGTILGYELPMNTISFQAACFIELSEAHLNRKIQALSCYESQTFRPYMDKDFIRSLSKVRGVQAGYGQAEAFEAIRLRF